MPDTIGFRMIRDAQQLLFEASILLAAAIDESPESTTRTLDLTEAKRQLDQNVMSLIRRHVPENMR